MPAGQRWYGHGRPRCSFCRWPGSWTCDWLGETGEKCGRLLCCRHRVSDGGEDRCQEHVDLALSSPLNLDGEGKQ